MATPGLLPFWPCGELLLGVLADCLEHEEPVVICRPQQALVDQGLERVEVGVADLLGGSSIETSRKYAEAREHLLLFLVEKVVAPLDRRAKGSLSLIHVAPS